MLTRSPGLNRDQRVFAPPWVGSRSPDGWDQIPRWAGGWACTSHPGVLGSIPKREEPGKTRRHPVLKYRVLHGSHFLQAHRETTAHFIATGLPSQQNRSDNAFRFERAAFYMGLKSKAGLVAAKASALPINLNIQGCRLVAPPLHAPSRAPLLLPLLLSHNIPLPRVH